MNTQPFQVGLEPFCQGLAVQIITRINHADIHCENFTSTCIFVESEDHMLEESLRTLIQGIGDYLTRVCGSVPIDLEVHCGFIQK